MANDARDGARDALRPPPGKLFWLDRIYRLVSSAISFGLYFLLGNVAAYLFSLLTYERWDGGILLTGAGIGALVGLASARKAYLGFGAERGDTHGSARFAPASELRADLAGDAGLIVGRELNGRKLLRYDNPAHLLTIAPTRSGKGVGTIVPNLLIADRSVLCIDPKGENARVTARAPCPVRAGSRPRSVRRVGSAWRCVQPDGRARSLRPRCRRRRRGARGSPGP